MPGFDPIFSQAGNIVEPSMNIVHARRAQRLRSKTRRGDRKAKLIRKSIQAMNSSANSPSHPLIDLPNISFVLAEQLAKIGVASAEALMTTGAETVWARLRAAGKPADIHTLFVLEGAIQGLPWRSLTTERRHELLRFANGLSALPAHASTTTGESAASSRIDVLRQRAAQFTTTIAAFEQREADLLQRQRGAADHVMVELDDWLTVCRQTLACLRRSLAVTRADLVAQEGRGKMSA